MIGHVKLYVATLALFLVLDMVWLGVVARKFYGTHLGFILADKPNWYAAFAFYALFVFGILYFVVVPGLGDVPLSTTLVRAALFGLITYATYDLTNLATVKDWPPIVTVVDMIWGTALSLMVSFGSLKMGAWLIK